jgi:ABC-type antimicrobial peptide transport system permease subunit
MFKNYFKTAWRNLARNKTYSFINIAGLTLGIAVCMVIFIIIRFHNSFDNFHKNKDGTYRLLTEFHHADSKDIFYGHTVPFGIPNGIKAAFPQIEQIAPLLASGNDQIVIEQNNNSALKKFKEEKGVFFTEPSFFKIFDFPLLAGSYESLDEPDNVLLSKETADKYFGDWKTAMGKTIRMNNDIVLKVSGILASIPANTDFQFKAVISYGTGYTKELKTSTNNDNVRDNFGCYILLPQNVNTTAFDKQLRAYSKKVKSSDDKDQLTMQPLAAAHFDTKAGNFSNNGISYTMINILWLIASFILLIACVNFINLSTAQAINRAKEVGVRKVLGSNVWQLRMQFITETFLIVLASILFALLLTWIVLPLTGKILGLSLQINAANASSVILFLIPLLISVTIVAGFYPSLVLSRFNPINALKSKIAVKSVKGISLRRGLVVFQFIIAQVLIIGTLVIVKQMNFFVSQPIGFDKDAIVNIPLPTDSVSKVKYSFIKTQLQQIKGIQQVTLNSNTPIEDNNDMWSTFIFNHAVKRTDFYAIVKMADNDYVPTYHLPLIAGRNMEPSDTIRELLVNEMLIKNLGINNPQDALNKEIAFNDRTKGIIVGVMKDFHTRSFRDGMAPIIITTLQDNYNEASVKLATKDAAQVMKSIGKLWNNTYPDFVYEYKFLDDKIAGFYKQENQLSQLYTLFACIAIFLSCLGLYGLASFMAVQRIKEVGVRKVLGATISGIVYLFSKEFVLLIAIAFAISTPIAWYFMNLWLQHFVFRIELSWWLFVIGGIASVIIALASVSFQAIKAAMANPVKSLRME